MSAFIYFGTVFLVIVLVLIALWWWSRTRKRNQTIDMSIIHCPHCNTESATEAQSCPSCGNPLRVYDPFGGNPLLREVDSRIGMVASILGILVLIALNSWVIYFIVADLNSSDYSIQSGIRYFSLFAVPVLIIIDLVVAVMLLNWKKRKKE
ncbi:hypothetical protein ACFLVP_02230 [Chloroflexota bacterium]